MKCANISLVLLITIFISKLIFGQEVPISTSQKFDNRGLPNQGKFHSNGHEIVSDFDGNVMINYNQTVELFNGENTTLSFFYNPNVEHRIFLDGPFSDRNGFTVNSPEWIIGFAGFAVQVLNFETEFYTTRGYLGIGGTMENSQVAMLIPGYHFSNKLSYDMSTEYGDAFVGHDVIQLLMADGSKKILTNPTLNNYTGTYYEEGVDNNGVGVVSFLNNSNVLRKMHFHPGDGSTYYFEEEFSRLNGKDGAVLNDPKAFYLKEIYSQLGDTLKLYYSNSFHTNENFYSISKGHKIFKYIYINKIFQHFDDGNINSVADLIYDILEWDGTQKLFSISARSKFAESPYVFTMDINSQTDLISVGNRDNLRKIVSVLQVRDPGGRLDNFMYNLVQREFSLNSYQSLVKINSPLISSISYNNGKKTEYTFYDKTFSGQSVLPIPIFTDNECIPQNLTTAFRDCYTNFMIKERNFYEDNSLVRNEKFSYSYSSADNNDLDYGQLLRSLVVKSLKTDKLIKNYKSGDTSIPNEDILNTKIYNRYKTGWYSYLTSDYSSATRLVEEKTQINFTNPSSNNYLKKTYNYEIGESSGSGYSYVRCTGNIKQLSSRETSFDGNVVRERLLDSLRILEREDIPITGSYSRRVSKKEENRDANNLLKIIDYKNYIPSAFTPNSFYKLQLVDQIKVTKNEVIISNDKFNYYEEGSIPGENPNGVMKGKLKQKINNYNQRSTFEDYRYYIPSESSRYKGYLKSITYSNGVKTDFSYPDKINNQDPQKPFAFDSVTAKKIDYNGGSVSDLFLKRYQQLKPFRTSVKYNNFLDSLVTYSAFDTWGNLMFEVDPNNYYSEFKYDAIGRIKSATFPGGFSNVDSVFTHTYSTIIIDTLNFSSEKGSYRTVKSDGTTYAGLDIVKTQAQASGNETDLAIKSDSDGGGETDLPNDTTHTKIPRNCYMFFHDPLVTSFIDSLISVDLTLITNWEYLPGASESRTVNIVGIRDDSTSYGTPVSFNFHHPHTYQNNEINIRPIIEEFISQGYTLIGFKFDSPSLTGAYEYNFKEFQFVNNANTHPYFVVSYRTTLTDVLSPEGSFFAYYDDHERSINSIRRFSNSPDKLSQVLEKTQYFDVEGNLIKNLHKNSLGNFIQKQKTEYNFLQAPKIVEDGENRSIFTKYDYLIRPIQLKTDYNWTIGPSKRINYYMSSENEYYNIEQITDENGKVSRKYFDKIGNLKKEERVDGELMLTTLYSYDDFYRLTSVTSPAGKITSYLYDDHSNISQKTSPDEGTTKYKYDKYDNLRFSINTGNSVALTFNKYDNFNRLILTGEYTFTNSFDLLNPDLDYSTNQGSISAFENYSINKGNFVIVNMYDNYVRTGVFDNLYSFAAGTLQNLKGRLVATAFRDKTSSTAWSFKVYSYDHLGRVKDEYVFFQSTSAYKKITNEYDNLGNLIKQNVDNQFYTWYGYDEQARLKEVRSNMNNAYTTAKLEAVYSYDQSDKVLSAKYGTYGNYAPKVLYTYDGKGRVSDINGIALDVFTTVFQQTLTYYNNDNIHTMFLRNDGNGSWPNLNFTYSYDNYNRLDSAVCSNPYYTETYAYDPDGNLTHKTRPYNTSQSIDYYYTTPGKNYLMSLTKGGTNYSFTYDYKGNMLTDTRKSIMSPIAYDRRNLPIKIYKPFGEYYDYYYDDGGQRIYKRISSINKEYYLRDHTGKELAVYDWYTGKLKMLNLYGNGIFGKVNVTYNAQNVRTDSRQYYIKDYLGSVRTTIDEKTFDVISAQDYFPFGGIMENRSYTTGGNINDKYKFTEKERDTETNYDYFGARLYDSEIGIWRSVDPLNQYQSPYTYCGNNPLRIIDKNGLYGEDVHHDLTYFMAIVVMGVSSTFASEIASANQGVDDNWDTASENPINTIVSNRNLHFLSQSSFGASVNLLKNTSRMSNSLFGKSLHSYQDIFFAHAGFLPVNSSGPNPYGHFPFNMDVDNVATNNVLKQTTVNMIKEVFEIMKKRNRGKTNVSFDELLVYLKRYVKEHGDFQNIDKTTEQYKNSNSGSNGHYWFHDTNRNWDQNWSVKNR
ncbi:MAG: hypothetical protein IH620_05385 [Ignavibacterium sp.]|nr:hypothetical protein [Ignavibacterium sp.]